MAGFKGIQIDKGRLAVETDRMYEEMERLSERKRVEYREHLRRFIRQVLWCFVLFLGAWLCVQAAKAIGGSPAPLLTGIGLALAIAAGVLINGAIVQVLGRVYWSAWREFSGREDREVCQGIEDIEVVGGGQLAMARISENVGATMSDMVGEALSRGLEIRGSIGSGKTALAVAIATAAAPLVKVHYVGSAEVASVLPREVVISSHPDAEGRVLAALHAQAEASAEDLLIIEDLHGRVAPISHVRTVYTGHESDTMYHAGVGEVRQVVLVQRQDRDASQTCVSVRYRNQWHQIPMKTLLGDRYCPDTDMPVGYRL